MAYPALLRALLLHRRRVLPVVRGQQAIWRGAAELIPDPQLRRAAVFSIEQKGRNAEATGVFALLAPPRRRRAALRAITALQTAVDYLDTLSEQPGVGLEDGLCLHSALGDAVTPGAAPRDWYRHHPRGEDGGYLAGLVGACQREAATLPAIARVLPTLREAARRCGEGQSRTHAAAAADAQGLEAWASGLDAAPGYLWWEVAAGASSSVAAHALIAAAADPSCEPGEARRIDAAYFPPIGALTVLLDDLVDRRRDAAAGEHSYVSYCAGADALAGRLGFLADRATVAARALPRAGTHAAILHGVAGFYLAALDPGDAFAAPARQRLTGSLGGPVRLVSAALRAGQLR